MKNEQPPSLAPILKKYENKLISHLFHEAEKPERMTDGELVLYDLCTGILKEIISDLTKIVKLP